MKGKIIIGLLVLTLILVPLLATACEEEEEPPPAQQEEEEEEEEEEDWWRDNFGEPEYGGSIVYAQFSVDYHFEPYQWIGIHNVIYEPLFSEDCFLDRDIFSFKYGWVPDDYWTGWLAESWEWPDPQKIIVHIREGVHWWDKPPANGREFTAYDVKFHFDRIMGTGSGFTEPSPFFGFVLTALKQVTATDEHTIEFEFFNPTPVQNMWTMLDRPPQMFENPEAIEEWGDYRDWTHVIATGPFIIEEVVTGSSITFSKNPDYWGTDPRYNDNQLPYIDEFKLVCIPDVSAQLSALRTGQVDIVDGRTLDQAQSIAGTNPEIEQTSVPYGANVVYYRADKGPFVDFRVREAMTMAVDREAIEARYGGDTDTTPYGVIYPVYKDWCFSYEDWPQELRDEYAYNPELARQLLAEAAADGIFEPNELGGFDTNILAPPEFNIELLEILQSYWMDIGVNMEIILGADEASVTSIINAKEQDQMDYGRGGTTSPKLMLLHFCSHLGQNRASHHDADFDALVDNFLNSSDLDEAKHWSVLADKYSIEQHWAFRAGMFSTYTLWQPYIKGYSGEGISNMCNWIWQTLWIDQDLKGS